MKNAIESLLVLLATCNVAFAQGPAPAATQNTAPPAAVETVQPVATQPAGEAASTSAAVGTQVTVSNAPAAAAPAAATPNSDQASIPQQSSVATTAGASPELQASESAQASMPAAQPTASHPQANVDPNPYGDQIPLDSQPMGGLTVGIAVAALSRADRGMEIFEGGGLVPQFNLLAGYDVQLTSLVRLGGELNWGVSAASSGDYFQGDLEASTTEHRAILSALVVLQLHPRIWPHLRLGGGLDAMKIHVDPDSARAKVDEWLYAPMGELALGATFQWPVGRRDLRGTHQVMRMGVRIEGGYALAKKSNVQLSSSQERSIDTRLANLGTLQAGGPLARVALLLRF